VRKLLFFLLDEKVSIRIEEQLAGILLVYQLKITAAVVCNIDLKSRGTSWLCSGNSQSKISSCYVTGEWITISVCQPAAAKGLHGKRDKRASLQVYHCIFRITWLK